MSIFLTRQTTFETGIFDDGAAEIVAHDPTTQRLFVTNGAEDTIDVLAFDDNGDLTREQQIDITQFGAGANSVAVSNGIVAAAVEVEDADGETTVPGKVVFFDTDGNVLGEVEAGVLPDMVTFTPDGNTVLVANEAEPAGGIDPEASVSVIDISNGVANATARQATFTAFNGQREQLEREGVRLFDGRSVSEDVEPEFITTSADGSTAFVTLQEANALAVLDVAAAEVTDIVALGTKPHSLPGNGLDTSNEDGAIDISPKPVQGLFMPDAIASYEVGGETYLVTANEGDSRDIDESDVADIALDPLTFPNAATLQQAENLGEFQISNIDGDTDGDGDFEELFSFGARSFTIWDSQGNQVFDSGDALESITATANPRNFNADNDENDPEGRSDNKGPEPEAVEVGRVGDSVYAFVGLERVGGVVVYDVTDAETPEFVQYINPRNFDTAVDSPEAGDIGPEGIKFVAAADAPGDTPVLLVSNEVSGSTSVFRINESRAADVAKLFVGYTGRAPDPAALDQFNGRFAEGASMAEVASDLARTQEAQDLNGFLANPTTNVNDIVQFLDTTYDNLFDRDIEQAGADYWAGVIQDKVNDGESVDNVILDIASGAQGQDLEALNNKTEAAEFYARTFATSGREWTFGDDVVNATEAVDDVDANEDSLAAARGEIEADIAADEVATIGTSESQAVEGDLAA